MCRRSWGVIVTRLVDDGSEYDPDDMLATNIYTTIMKFPFSIYVWQVLR